MPIAKVKVELFDRAGILRTAYFYFMKNASYTPETPTQFIEQNQHFIGAKAESVAEIAEFETLEAATADCDANTGVNHKDGAMYSWPPLEAA